MKRLLICLAVASCVAFAQTPPALITIEYDNYNGYGTAPLTAIANLWPSCTIESFNGNPSGWVDAIDSSTDIVIGDMHNYALMDDQRYSYLTDWYNDPALGPMWYASWQMSNYLYDDPLTAAMGITSSTAISMPPITHYAWDTSHQVFAGITDLSYADPGYNTGGHRITVGTATPISGWTSGVTAGQAAICVAPDGNSIISGYFASLNPTQAVDMWENILQFMWGESSLTPATWGSIKSEFGLN